jgi:hypothetical protein
MNKDRTENVLRVRKPLPRGKALNNNFWTDRGGASGGMTMGCGETVGCRHTQECSSHCQTQQGC